MTDPNENIVAIQPVEPIPEPALTLDDDLEFTRHLKRKIVASSFTDGKLNDADDPKSRDFILRVMDSIDKSALGRKRIEVEEGANEIARATNGFLAELHTTIHNDPLRSTNPAPRNISPDIQAAKDVTDIMLSKKPEAGKTNYEEFTAEFLESHPEYDN